MSIVGHLTLGDFRMSIVRIGSETEFVEMALPPFTKHEWGQAVVEIAVQSFRGTVKPWVDFSDVKRFATGLREVFDSLSGQADFTPIERQFTLTVCCGTRGQITVNGEAWSNATYGNRLDFVLEIDQTYLRQPLQQLEDLVAAQAR